MYYEGLFWRRMLEHLRCVVMIVGIKVEGKRSFPPPDIAMRVTLI